MDFANQDQIQDNLLEFTPHFGYGQHQHQQMYPEQQREEMIMDFSQLRDGERKSILNPKFNDFKNSMKEKCIQRLNDQRRSYVQAYRQTRLKELTESKRRPEIINTEINDKMMYDNQIGSIIEDEFKNCVDYDINQLIEAYEELQREMQDYLIENHMKNFEFDEAYHYELYERANSKETELHAQLYDPSNRDIYICALCKNLVLRVNRTRLTCSKVGCVNIDLFSENFKPQEVMDYLQKSVIDHRETQEHSQQPNDCLGREQETFRVCVRSLQFLDREEEEDGMQGIEQERDLNIVIECTNCTHLDFIALENLLREY